MTTVWKFPLIPTKACEPIEISMPRHAAVLHVGVQDGIAYLWAQVNTNKPMETYKFHALGTGWEFPKHVGRYIGTFQIDDGLVFHVYDHLET